MKFKRFLASMLSVLTIASCFAFTASADETSSSETTKTKDPIFVALASKQTGQVKQNEHGYSTAWNYDATNNVAYSRHTAKPYSAFDSSKVTEASYNGYTFYVNGFGIAKNTVKASSTSVTELYLVGYFRTNIESTEKNKPFFNLYSVRKDVPVTDENKDGYETKSNIESQKLESYKGDGTWQKQIICMNAAEVATFAQNGYYSVQVAWRPVGDVLCKDYAETDKYVDVAGFAIFEDKASAEAYDIKAASGLTDAQKNITVTFDPHNGSAATTITYLSKTWTAGETNNIEFPKENPTREGFTFKGWSATNHGTVLEDTSNIAVGTANVTYYGIWESTETETPAVGDCVYVSDSGCDTCCHGLSATYPKGTVSGAMPVINKNESVNTIKVVEEITQKVTGNIGTTAKKIYVTGNASAEDAFKINGNVSLKLDGDVEFKNVTVTRGGGDGGVIACGHNLTMASDVKIGSNVNIAQGYYGSHQSESNTVELKTGTYPKVQEGIFSGGTYTGNSTYNIVGNANVTAINAGHGYSDGNSVCTQTYYGTSTMNIGENATVGTINFSTTGNNAGKKNTGKFYGIRYYNIKDNAKVTTFQTTSNHANDRNADALIITISDKATVGTIKAGSAEDTTSKRYVIFNNGVTAINVADEQAVVMDVTGASLSAKAEYIASSTDNVYASVSGFEYALADESYNIVTIGKTEYALSDFTDNLIPADKFVAGVNTVVFSKKETAEKTETEKQLEEKYAGYEIVYVSSNGSGNADGSSVANAKKGLGAAINEKTASGKKVVIALTDEYDTYTNKDNITATAQGELVITSAGGKLNLGDGSYSFNGDKDANIIFDNIEIIKGKDERGISAQGNNITLTDTVTVTKADSTDTEDMFINAAADGSASSNGNTVTINTPSTVKLRGSGWTGCNINGNVKYVIGEKANVSSIIAAGKVGNTTETPSFKGNATVDIYGKVGIVQVYEANSKLDTGSFYVNVYAGANVTTINFNGENTVAGNAIAKIDGGTVTTIIATANVAKKTAAIINTDKAIVGEIGENIGYTVQYNGDKGKVTLSDDVSTINVEPNAGVKYVKITNGNTVKTYNVNGDEVQLAQDLSAIALAAGTTVVDFLEDGTEKITLSFFANIEDEETAWVTKTVTPNATDDVLPVWSDVPKTTGSGTREEVVGTNDIYARPDRSGYRFLGWATTKTATNPDVVFGTFTAPTENASYYAVYEEAKTLKGDGTDVTVQAASAFTVPNGATQFTTTRESGEWGGAFATAYNSDGTTGVKINAGAKVAGISYAGTTTSSYYGTSSSKAPASIWFKYNDGTYLGAKSPYSGKVGVAYVVNGAQGSTKRGFWLEAGNVNGSIDLDTTDGAGQYVVSFETELNKDDFIKYAATYNFDNNTIKVAQLESIYVWQIQDDDPTPANTKVYLSDSGNDENHGLTAEKAVKTIEKVQEILTENENIDTLVIVGTVKYTSGKTIGVPSRKITITANDENALWDLNDENATDDRLTCGGDIEFKNINVRGFSGDGRISANGYTLTIGEGFNSKANQFSISTDVDKDSNIIVTSGNISKILPGFHGYATYSKSANVTVSGNQTTVDEIALAHGYMTAANGYTGKLYADIKDGATVKNILIDSDNNNCIVNYDGIRYFTITDSTVNAIRTTGRHNGYEKEVLKTTATKQTGVTVFEINGNSTIGAIAPSAESIDTATRVIIFNNYGYSADIVKDTEAITANVKNGSLKASVENNVFKGFTYTTEKTRVYINGQTYELVSFEGNVIPAEKFNAGLNTVIFTNTGVSQITWVNGEEQTVELAENGSKLTHADPTKKADKDYYYTFGAWYTDIDVQSSVIDLATYEVSEDVTLTAYFIPTEMPDGVTKKFANDGSVGSVSSKGGFTSTIMEDDVDGTANAVKIIPDAASDVAISIEGWDRFPKNYSTGSETIIVDSNIYKYFVVRYYYGAGTNTAERKIGLNTYNDPIGNAEEIMTANKWSYFACELTSGKTRQYHIYAMNGVKASTLAANNEVFYLDTLILFKDKPTIADIKFTNDETVLYAIEALNGESVKYNGATPEKDNCDFAGWNIVGDANKTLYTNAQIETLQLTQDTEFVAVFTEKPEQFPTQPTYRTYGTYDITKGTYTVELKVGGAKLAGGSFGFTFPQSQMTFVSAIANDKIGAEFLANGTNNALSPIYVNENGNYANTWSISNPEYNGMCDATQDWVTVATLNFTMTAEQRAAFEAANKTIAEFVMENPDVKYYNNGHYLVYPFVETIDTPKQEITYDKHIDAVTQSKEADVTFEITLPEKSGATNVNIGKITYFLKADENDVSKYTDVEFDVNGTTVDETKKLTKTIENLTVGSTYVFKIQKNGYIPVSVELLISDDQANIVSATLICGDIKGTENAICGDGKINLDDFIRVIRGFESDEGKDDDEKNALEDYKANVDINEDGAVNVEDLAIIKKNFGKTQAD